MKSFGGSHTLAKLDCLSACLDAFTSAMQASRFRLKYVDPFAGYGRWSPKLRERAQGFFPQPSTPRFDGSARIALGFGALNRFQFADEDQSNVRTLKSLRSEFPDSHISVRKADANVFLKEICEETDWEKWRGFVFLDPFGLPPYWQTLKGIAKTCAMDLLCLFPPGINRLLTLDGITTPANKLALDRFCPSLYGACYRESTTGFFETRRVHIKVVKSHEIAKHYGTALRTIFKHVVRRPLPLNLDGGTYYLWGAVADNDGATERLKSMQNIFSDPEIRWRAKQRYNSANQS